MPSLTTIGLSLVALLVGVGIVLQQAVNADLKGALDAPAWAALISFTVGTLALAAVVGVLREPVPSAQAFARLPWYAWTGGLLGAFYVLAGVYLVPRLGAAAVIGLFIVGQLLTSLVVDHLGLLGVPQHDASWARLAGAGLLLTGIALISAF